MNRAMRPWSPILSSVASDPFRRSAGHCRSIALRYPWYHECDIHCIMYSRRSRSPGRAWGPAPLFGAKVLHSAQCTAPSHVADSMPPFCLPFMHSADKIYARSARDAQTGVLGQRSATCQPPHEGGHSRAPGSKFCFHLRSV